MKSQPTITNCFLRNGGGTVGLNKFSSRFTCFWVVVGIAAIFVLGGLADDAADNHRRKRFRSSTRFP